MHGRANVNEEVKVVATARAAEFAAYDALPSHFKKLLQDAVVPFSSVEVLQIINQLRRRGYSDTDTLSALDYRMRRTVYGTQ